MVRLQTTSSIAVLDIGKTNAKLCVVDAVSGELLCNESTHVRAFEGELYSQLDTDALWHWYLGRLKALSKTINITHIVATAHGATAALADDHGLVFPVMDYEAECVDDLAKQYNQVCDPFSATYSPKLPLGLNLARQLYWQREKFPERFTRVKYIIPYAQYWSYLLTGKPVCEVSTIGAHSDLWNPTARTWSDFAVREGFSRLFPTMMRADEVLGSPLARVTNETGIDKNCKVLVGIHDSNASLIPWMKSQALPFTVMSTGTWAINFALGSPLAGLRTEKDCIANVNMHSQPIACSLFMGGREFSAIAGSSPAIATIDDLIRIIDDDVFALPAFAATGGPFAGKKGEIIADRDLSMLDRYALASIYCALISDESLTACGSSGDIIVEGAFSSNDLLLQCLAVYRDQQAVFASSDSTGTTMGTAMLVTDNIETPDLVRANASPRFLVEKLQRYKKRWHQQLALKGIVDPVAVIKS